MKKRLTSEEITRIRNLRERGYSLPEIKKETKRGNATILRYLKGVSILPEFISTWSQKRGGSKARRILKENKAFEEAKAIVSTLSQKEKLLFLAALYWGEGNKKDFILTNSDPALIKVFIECMKDVFNLPKEKFRISIRVFKDLDKNLCLDFWSKVTGIEKQSFVNVNVLDGQKNGKLTYGMCRVRVSKGSDLLKKVLAVNKAVHVQMSL